MTKLLILGGGSCAREFYYFSRHLYMPSEIFFYDDITTEDFLKIDGHQRPIYHSFNGLQKYRFIIGVGEPHIKRILVKKALEAELQPAASVVHPSVHGDEYSIGLGGMITPGVVITTNVKLGDYLLLNLNCTVAHDSTVGDFSTLNAGTHISGKVTIGSDVYLGAGTTVRENIKIASGVKIGTQACIVKDINEPGTYVGVPAKKLVKRIDNAKKSD